MTKTNQTLITAAAIMIALTVGASFVRDTVDIVKIVQQAYDDGYKEGFDDGFQDGEHAIRPKTTKTGMTIERIKDPRPDFDGVLISDENGGFFITMNEILELY